MTLLWCVLRCQWFLPPLSLHHYSKWLCVLSRFSHIQLCVTPWTVACQAPLSMGLSRQGYWSGLLCPPSGDLPAPEMELVSLTSNLHWQAGFFFFFLPLTPPGKPGKWQHRKKGKWCLCIFIILLYFLETSLTRDRTHAPWSRKVES